MLISSAFVGGPFLSRKHYQEFVVPYERRVTRAIKSTGTPVYTHTCGSIGDRLDLFVETGTQVSIPGPAAAWKRRSGRVKRDFGQQFFFKGI